MQLINTSYNMTNGNDNDNIEMLYNELVALNGNKSSDPALLNKVSSLEDSLQSAHQTLAEARISIKRKDKEIEELRAKVDDTGAEERERIAESKAIELELKVRQIKDLEDQISEMRKKET